MEYLGYIFTAIIVSALCTISSYFIGRMWLLIFSLSLLLASLFVLCFKLPLALPAIAIGVLFGNSVCQIPLLVKLYSWIYDTVAPLGKSAKNIFGSKAELQMHTQNHMSEAKPFKCPICSSAFANEYHLLFHSRIHDLEIKLYPCNICRRKFTQLSHLQEHIPTHTVEKLHKCQQTGCYETFKQLSILQMHSCSHQFKMPYKCNSCYICFIDEDSLLEHIPEHKNLKNHLCQYCGDSYTQETDLQKHMQTHSKQNEPWEMVQLPGNGWRFHMDGDWTLIANETT